MPTALPETSPLRPFIYHGVNLALNGGGQAIGDCPFCNLRKLYVNPDSGLWDCKHCALTGNPLGFLRKYHEECMSYTTEEQYKELAQERGYLSTESLVRWGLCWSSLRDEWVIPGYYRDTDELKQLYRYTNYGVKDGKRRLMATPTFAHCLYNVRNYNPDKNDVFITEGPWDAIALEEILRLIKVNEEGGYEITGNESSSLYANSNVLAIPSTNTFIELWAMLMKGKRVFLCLDNDHPKNKEGVYDPTKLPGTWNAYKRITRLLVEWDIRPSSLFYLAWGHDKKERTHNLSLPSGHDVRDLLKQGYEHTPETTNERIEAIETRSRNLQELYSYFKPVPTDWIDPDAKPSDKSTGKKKDVGLKVSSCTEWNVLIDAWREALVWHDGLEKTLSCMLACTMSTAFPGTQLWLRVISAPSTGKSVLCDALCVNRDYVTMQSNIRGFFSGMRPTKKDAKEGKTDLGLITEIMGKTFVTKDADPILQAPERPRIMAEARDLYDGGTKTHFRTGMGQEYPTIRTTWIFCGTDRVRDSDENDLGGRFLDCILLKEPTPDLKKSIALCAIKNMRSLMRKKVTENIESMDEIHRLVAKKLTGGYIDYLCKNGEKLLDAVMSHDDDEVDQTIATLAEFVSIMRARPSKQDENPTVELYGRLSEQLFRLAGCLAVVLNKEQIDSVVVRRVTEIAFDTSEGSTLKMTRFLWSKGNTGASYVELQEFLQRKEGQLSELLRFLRRVGAYETFNEQFHGRHVYNESKYKLSDSLHSLCDTVFAYER